MASEGLGILDYEWHCPSCTYINKAGSFKCFMCGTPKGTSTRQVKFSFSTIEQQYVAESLQSMSRVHGTKSAAKLYAGSGTSGKKKVKTKTVESTTEITVQEETADINFKDSREKKDIFPVMRTGELGRDLFVAITRDKDSKNSGEKKGAVHVEKKATKSFSSSMISCPVNVKNKKHHKSKWPKLYSIDRSSRRRQAVTVNSLTVYITEYKSLCPKSD